MYSLIASIAMLAESSCSAIFVQLPTQQNTCLSRSCGVRAVQFTVHYYKSASAREDLVELVGIEPTTSSLRTMRSPS